MARDGAEAVEQCGRDTPDLILMDLMMPVMDGAEATRRIMSQSPCPILIVTAGVETYSAKVFEALGSGALDAVQTPLLVKGGQTTGSAALKFKIGEIERLGSSLRNQKRLGKDERKEPLVPRTSDCLIAMGASAGGSSRIGEGPERPATRLPGRARDRSTR